MLTDLFVRKAKPGDHADTGGLYLRVSPKGKKVWILRSQKNGKNLKKSLGTYPGMGLADARRISQGNGIEITSAEAVRQYMEKLAVRRPAQVKSLLTPLDTLDLLVSHTRQDLMEKLQAKAKKAPTQANRMLTRWKDLFAFCMNQGWLDRNPLDSAQRKFVGGREKSRDRNLSWGELALFLKHLNTMHPDTAMGLYMILATGLRSSEALWVMEHKKLTAIPTKENPDPAIHKIPAVPHVRALLKRSYKTPASNDTLSNAMRRIYVEQGGIDGVPVFKPHDLRRTFASRMADLGVAPHVIEKMLDHKLQGMMAVYNHAEYWPERTAAMKLWGQKLSALRRSAKAAHASSAAAET